MKMRFKFRFYPTALQEDILEKTFGSCRYVYNWALQLRTSAYSIGEAINYQSSSAALTKLKKQPDHAWMYGIACVPMQQSLRHLQSAFQNFFDKRSGYPKFKRKKGKQSAEYTRSAFSWEPRTKTLVVCKLGRLHIKWSRKFISIPSTVTIIKSPDGRFHVTLVVDEEVRKPIKTERSIGIDLGINQLATLSNGVKISNPRYLDRYRSKLARAERVLSRKKIGSNRREKQRLRVAKIQSKIANCRNDNMHKITTKLVREFDIISVEDLNTKGMIRNHNLAKSLSDVAFGTFISMLEYKCEWRGKSIVKINRFYPSSKKCSSCGYVVNSLPLNMRKWICPECNEEHDRDVNAAKNILAAGQAVSARGGSVRPVRAQARDGNTRRTANQPDGQGKPRSSGILAH